MQILGNLEAEAAGKSLHGILVREKYAEFSNYNSNNDDENENFNVNCRELYVKYFINKTSKTIKTFLFCMF